MSELPGDVWGVLGLAIVTLGGQLGAHLNSRRQRRTQTERVVETLTSGLAAVKSEVATVKSEVGRVAERLDEHIEATNGRIRDGGDDNTPVPLERRRRRAK